MKNVIIALIILLIIIAGLIAYYNGLVKMSEDLFETISKIQRAIITQDWEIADNEVDILIEKWEKYSSLLSNFIDHQEVDNIMDIISRMEQYLKYREESELMAEIATLNKFIEHIPYKESLRLENIF